MNKQTENNGFPILMVLFVILAVGAALVYFSNKNNCPDGVCPVNHQTMLYDMTLFK